MNEHEHRDYFDARRDIDLAKRCLERVRETCPSRELSLAFTKLQEARMWLDEVTK